MEDSNLVTQMANIERRLRALKAVRPVHIGQISMLDEEFTFNVTLQPPVDPADDATFELVVECSGDPLISIGIDGYDMNPLSLVVGVISQTLVGTTATFTIKVDNHTAGVLVTPVIIKVWALNGLSATCVRTS